MQTEETKEKERPFHARRYQCKFWHKGSGHHSKFMYRKKKGESGIF